jgi:hypothetical protein
MTDPIPTNEYIEVTAAEIAAYWRNEGRHIDVATAVEDDLTKEYAAKAIGTADILDTLLSALKAEKKRADEAERTVSLLRDAARGSTVITNTAAVEIRTLRAEVERLRAFHERVGQCGRLLQTRIGDGPTQTLTVFRMSDQDDIEISAAYHAALTKKEQSDEQG